MNRAGFLQTLISSIAIGKLPVSLTKDFRKIYLLQCFIAGFRHYEGVHLLPQLKEGDLLELVREPKNEYDSCAIALHWQGKKLGFIPADINEMLSYLLDAEALSLFALITHLEHSAKPWENVAVAVYFVQEVNKDLPAHACYLTRIEAPHYRTLKHKEEVIDSSHKLEKLFSNRNRTIAWIRYQRNTRKPVHSWKEIINPWKQNSREISYAYTTMIFLPICIISVVWLMR